MRRPTVLLADDHAIVAEGLATILAGEFTVVGTVGDGNALLKAARERQPDVVVTDVAMPGMGGLDAIRRFQAEGITARIVLLTMHAEPELAAEAFKAGASAFLVKSAAGRELITAIREVLLGRTYLTPLVTKDVLGALAAPGTLPAGRLTPRQRDVLRLIAEGRTMKEIGAALGLSTRTVETHKYQMMHALGVGTTAELIRHALEHGLTSPLRRGENPP